MTSKKKDLAEPAAMPGPAKDGSDDDYEARNAMEDITRAQQHLADPDMMKRVHKHVGRKMKALQGIKSIKDIRGAYDEMNQAEIKKRTQNPRDKM